MVTVNGQNPAKKTGQCKVCGAKMRAHDGGYTCPNADRKDHKGEAYNGRA